MAPTVTTIDSDITADTTWTVADSPYLVTEEIYVKSGATLTLEPGVTVWIGEKLKIYVEAGASFIAKGTPDQHIFIDRYRDPNTGLAKRWKNIRLYPNSTSYFRYVDFAYGGSSSEESTILHYEGPGTHVLNRCSISDSKLQGVTAQLEGLDLTIAGTSFIDNGRWSLAVDSGAEVTVTGSTFDVGDKIAVRLRDKGFGPAKIIVNESNFLTDGSNFIVYNEIGSITIDAENNWWGQASGPDEGAIVGPVDYEPWRTTEAPIIGITTPPTATFTITPNPEIVQPSGTEYTFDASGSSDVEDYTSSLEVCWDWDNNGACDTDWTTEKTAKHIFSTVTANQTIRLVVRDTDDDTSEATKEVVLDNPPMASLSVDPDPSVPRLEGTVYTFDASSSYDVEDATGLLEVCWDWDNSGACDTSWTTDKTETHSFAYEDGAEQVMRLVVRDTALVTDDITATIHVIENLAPEASLTVSRTAWNWVEFDASGTTDDHDAAGDLQVAWDYEGDGEHTPYVSYTDSPTTVYTYPHQGRYWPALYVKDSVDKVGVARQTLDILPPTKAISLTGSGGVLTSTDGTVEIAFYTDTVETGVISGGVVITHTPWLTLPHNGPDGIFTYQGFSLSARSLDDGQILDQISGTYTITLYYDYEYFADVLKLPFESKLELYRWSDTESLWTPVTAELDAGNDQMKVKTDLLGDFALVIDASRVYLPMVANSD
jgi:hypothetical protein